jgi:hypothetical protein
MPYNRYANTQSTYGSGLGNIYQYGAANPRGPYSFLPQSGGTAAAGGASSQSTTAAGGGGAGEAFFNGVLSGDKMPFNPATRANMVSRASDMTAAAEGANNQRAANNAAAGGASASDPSFQAAQMGNQAARQTANQTAVRDIDTTAEQQNFGAQMNAAEALNRNAMTREGYANGLSAQAMSFLPWNQGGSRQSGGNNFQGNGFLQYGSAYGSPSDREMDAQAERTRRMLAD